MIRFLLNVPIKRKLTIIAMLTTTLALGLACAAFTLYDQASLRRDLVRDLSSTADMVGFNTASALSLADRGSAERILSSLAAHRHVAAACVYRRDGTPFAAYFRTNETRAPFPTIAESDTTAFGRRALELVRPITVEGERIGGIYLRSDLTALRERMKRSAIIFVVVMLGAGLGGYLIVSRLQRVISDPVTHLAAVAARVAAESNYAVRATKQGDDEIGALIDSFNEMLILIQARDRKLHQTHDELEQRVEARTRELASSVSLLNATLDSTTDGIVATNHSGEVVCYNRRFAAMWGLSSKILSRRNNAEVIAASATQVRDPDGFVRRLCTRSQPGDSHLVDVIDLVDGRTFERYIHPQRVDGHDIGVVMSYRDVTERKQAQEEVARERARFKFIFEAVPVGISMVTPGEDGTLVVNPAHVVITGVSVADSGRPGIFASVSHPEDYRRQEEYVKRYSSGAIDHFTIEKRYLHPGGKIVWAALTSRLFTDASTGRRQSVTTLVDITERKRAEARLAETHRQLLATSRQAGMAEVATGVLHNVGNVLNSVNVSTTLLTDLVRQSKINHVARLADLLEEQRADLARFLTVDARGRKLPEFVQTLSSCLTQEQRELLAELESLRKNIEHIKEIVAMQQGYARVSGVTERVSITELVEAAVAMNAEAFARHDIQLVRDFQANPSTTLEKHKVLQILVNVLRNAKYACDDSGRSDKRIVLLVTATRECVRISVADNGVGIPAQNLTRIFAHGFTTRKEGHGFGLHSGALAAKELGGALIAQSEGPGRGATFILELPLRQEAKAA